MGRISSFRDLKVYNTALTAAGDLFLISKGFPPEERYALTSQMRRSSRAVSALVAEAWARRRYEAAFINKISEAQGEAMETQSWLDHALICEYIDVARFNEADSTWQYIGAMLQRMISQSAKFCGKEE